MIQVNLGLHAGGLELAAFIQAGRSVELALMLAGDVARTDCGFENSQSAVCVSALDMQDFAAAKACMIQVQIF